MAQCVLAQALAVSTRGADEQGDNAGAQLGDSCHPVIGSARMRGLHGRIARDYFNKKVVEITEMTREAEGEFILDCYHP